MASHVAQAAATAGVVLVVTHLWLMASSLGQARREIEETGKIRRLVTVTLQNFSDPKLLTEREFWKQIGREQPMLDSWGTPYRLDAREVAGASEFFWRSAGTDRVMGSGDDLVVQVPFVDGGRDLGPAGPEMGAPVLDAK